MGNLLTRRDQSPPPPASAAPASPSPTASPPAATSSPPASPTRRAAAPPCSWAPAWPRPASPLQRARPTPSTRRPALPRRPRRTTCTVGRERRLFGFGKCRRLGWVSQPRSGSLLQVCCGRRDFFFYIWPGGVLSFRRPDNAPIRLGFLTDTFQLGSLVGWEHSQQPEQQSVLGRHRRW